MTANAKKKNLKQKHKLIAVVGPTASGKTLYAIELAKKIDGEIISADSRLVYKGLNIGTAKPSLGEMDGIPHYLIDVVEPETDYSVGCYVKQAEEAINDIISRGKTPIMVGGTGLYFRVLLESYDLPKVEADYQLRNELRELAGEDLYKMLLYLDEETAITIEKNDKKKLIRAIEIVKSTGKPVGEVRGVKESDYEVEWWGCNFKREELYNRINKRVDVMVENGLIEETKDLLNKHGRINNLIHTIGYKEITSYLDGNDSLDEALDKLKQNSRNYAKRQLTWFRKNENINWNCYPERM